MLTLPLKSQRVKFWGNYFFGFSLLNFYSYLAKLLCRPANKYDDDFRANGSYSYWMPHFVTLNFRQAYQVVN